MSVITRTSVDDLAIILILAVVFFVPNLLNSSDAETGTVSASPTATATITSVSETVTSASSVAACDFREEIDRVRDATVRVVVQLADGQIASGTGFHLGDGVYVTAAHVVTSDDGGAPVAIMLQSAASASQSPATISSTGDIAGTDGWGRDLAVLRADPVPSSIGWRAPSQADVDGEVRVLGYPWSQEADSGETPPPVIVRGTLAFLGRVGGIEVVQSSARAEEGMSGGPLVDECGDALAVVTGARVGVSESGLLKEGFAVFMSMSEFERLP